MGKHRTIGAVRTELVAKSREAALCAIKVYNDPAVTFKSETFIVLMVIAWTYLLHAYYRGQGIEYRYVGATGKRRTFSRTKQGAYKYWELERCLSCPECPVDATAIINLKFLIGLRHEIEHQMTRALDSFVSSRYQACAINYNDYLKKLFGVRHGIDKQLGYSIQFLALTEAQINSSATDAVPQRLKAFIDGFDEGLAAEHYNSPRFAYRLLFTRKLVNHVGQADCVVEFIHPSSPLAKTISEEFWVKKEVERPKFRATDVVNAVQGAGFAKFRLQPHHTNMWKADDARHPSKGYGVSVQGTWFWYASWVDRCIELCTLSGDKYRDAVP